MHFPTSSNTSQNPHFFNTADLMSEQLPLSEQNLNIQVQNCLLSFRCFIVVIEKIKIFDLGVELEIQLLSRNGSFIQIPVCYQSEFEKILNIRSQSVSYRCLENSQGITMTLGKSDGNVIDFLRTMFEKEESNIKYGLIQIGLLKASQKLSVQMTRKKLILKKSVVDSLITSSDCSKFPQIPSKFSPVKQVQQVTEIREIQKPNKGGYFEIKKVNCEVKDASGDVLMKDLACKKIREDRNAAFTQPKLQKQLQLASKLIDTKHFANYFVVKSEKKKFYMDYIPGLLKEHIYKKKLPILEIVDICKQLVEAVDVMHQSGIVHRDLKPQNILIENVKGKNVVKIIDFGESTLKNETFDKKIPLGCTLPYSPIECISSGELGFNKEEIDLWSLAIILYEICFQNLPMFYSRCIGPEIILSWKAKKDDSFSISALYRKKRGMRAVEEMMSVVGICGLKVEQSERLRLNSFHRIFSAIQYFLN